MSQVMSTIFYEVFNKKDSLIGQHVFLIVKRANRNHLLLFPHNWNHGCLKHNENMLSELEKIGIPAMGIITSEHVRKRSSYRGKNKSQWVVEHDILVGEKTYYITHDDDCFSVRKVRNKDYVSLVDHYCSCFDRSYFVNNHE